MEHKTIKSFKTEVSAFFKREGIDSFSCIPENCTTEFSWSNCDCCDSHLGGERHTVSEFHSDTDQVLEYDVCVDCLLYVVNGDEPDAANFKCEAW